MELNAVARTIKTLLSVNVKYIVPRFQREYSWGKDEITELWNDIIFNLKVDSGEMVNQEYFIGSLVLIGEDRSSELQIVDGQQRLTTITIILSALVQTFKDISKDNLANAIYTTYIEGRDDDNESFFKLVNENPRPFLQESIQYIDKIVKSPSNKEEKTLWNSYNFFYQKLKLPNLSKEYQEWNSIGKATKDENYLTLLKGIRDQVLAYLKVIYITVANEDDAYMIFETLNARGKNLSSVDLVKNELFKNLKKVHPDDSAKRTWKQIQLNLGERSQKINIETFFRHYWLSKYNYVTESKIFKNFKKKSSEGALIPVDFLNDLEAESKIYNRIANPLEIDWTNQDDRPVFDALQSLSLFQISQVRSFLLALLIQRSKGVVAHSDYLNFLRNIENFHFKYTAICSLKMNIFEGKYSKAARDLRKATNKLESREVLNELVIYYRNKVPDISLFTESFNKLKYTKNQTKDKKLIQYVFKKHENYLRKTNEIALNLFSLEHILPQSTYISSNNIGKIGNLLPLNKQLNEQAGDKGFMEKLITYKASELKIVTNFAEKYGHLDNWTNANIDSRTNEIATIAYNDIWSIR